MTSGNRDMAMVTRSAVDRVVVLQAAGRLSDVVVEVNAAVRHALAEEPRGVVCDLAGARDCRHTGSLRALASSGIHARSWPAVPVAMVLTDPDVRRTLWGKPLGAHLVITESLSLALASVSLTTAPSVDTVRLAPHPTAPRAARKFVCKVLGNQADGERAAAACVVVSELVTNAMVHAGTPMDVSLAVSDDRLRIAVRDLSPGSPRQAGPSLGVHGRGLTIVDAFSTAWGMLPTAEGGKVVWAVLETSR